MISLPFNRQEVEALWKQSPVVFLQWSETPPVGVGYSEHKLSIIDSLHDGIAHIVKWNTSSEDNCLSESYGIIAGVKVHHLLATLPRYIPRSEKPSGWPEPVGTLNGRFGVYHNLGIPENGFLLFHTNMLAELFRHSGKWTVHGHICR